MNFWKCPNCGREFSKKGQFHSCVSISVYDHFKNRPDKLREIFELLKKEIEKFGQVRIDAVKTSINFGGKSQFGVIFVLKDNLTLDFVMERKIDSPRFFKTRGPTNNYYTYTIKLKNKKDINLDLIDIIIDNNYLRATPYTEFQMSGEPTLHIELKEIVQKIRNTGTFVGLSSNIVKVNKKTLEIFNMLDSLTISFDCYDKKLYEISRYPNTFIADVSICLRFIHIVCKSLTADLISPLHRSAIFFKTF